MKKYLSISILFIACTLLTNAQGRFSCSVSNDSILIGNTCTVNFTLENIDGDFEPPLFENLNVVSGPNTSSSFQFINGESTNSTTYSYIIKPTELGEFVIDQAFVLTGDETYETDFVTINVYPNPEGIIQEAPQMIKEFNFSFPWDDNPFQQKKEQSIPKKEESKKKKYKLKKL